MQGQEHIVNMRKHGATPKIVFLNDWLCDTDWYETGDAATVCVHGDSIKMLDLRFLVGLKVSISSESEIRAKALFNTCKAAGCKTVAACHTPKGETSRNPTGWAEVWHSEVAQ
jgi:hypothetical protein